MKKKWFWIPMLIASVALALTACSGEGSTSNAFTVKTDDSFQYSPSTLTVKAGQEVQLTFENNASVEHSFNILKLGEELEHVLEEAHDEEALHEELVFEMHEVTPGQSTTEAFTAPSEPGDYTFFCAIPGHAEAGEVGTLRVAP